MSAVLRLADAASVGDLGRFAARARAVDDEGAMRLQADGEVLAAWVGVLQGSGILAEGTVLGLRTFALAEPAECDAVVPLGAVTDRTARADGSGSFDLPPTRALAAWSAVTPPRSGWERAGEVSADVLADAARSGLEQVSAAVRERGAAAGFVRDRVWGEEAVPGVRAGGAFAAFSLGFLRPGSVVSVWRSNRWTRVTATGGHVLMR
ncbi:hypothetical protein JQN72_08375 [Phycicoccus sp. CSK15P-2]|uniref:hypothetical protein n=1 Tax=Phycicoccus sp. CSK15P-2 TaxID=2807627 RepID=UPI00194F766E|nr:hypothetical protein [Phycicoccus sp. CSK15P-2]MBM6404256.1 hypothetical protein [Phycicoccus sp. CSK15P-2]